MRSFTKEQIISAYQNSPALVREAFNSEETIATIGDIRTRYNLHIDTAGTLGENVGYMLVGLLSPSEFFGDMVLSGIDQETAKGVLEALNTRIFIPLRDRIKNPGQAPKKAVPPYVEAQPVQKEKVVPPPPSIEVTPAPVVPPPPVPQSKPPYNLVPDAKVEIRTMAQDMEHLKDGTYGVKPVSTPLTQNIQPEHVTPARSFQTASIPVQMSQPVYKAAPEAVVPPISQPQQTQPERVAIAPAPAAISSDPYREPI